MRYVDTQQSMVTDYTLATRMAPTHGLPLVTMIICSHWSPWIKIAYARNLTRLILCQRGASPQLTLPHQMLDHNRTERDLDALSVQGGRDWFMR